jgi:hypothetical protein
MSFSPWLSEKGNIVLGMVDLIDLFVYDDLPRILQRDIDIALVRESELLNTLIFYYWAPKKLLH